PICGTGGPGQGDGWARGAGAGEHGAAEHSAGEHGAAEHRAAGRRLGMTDRWRPAVPELVIAAITVTAATLAAAAVSGWPGAVTVAVATAVVALLMLRGLIPRSAPQPLRLRRDKQQARAIHGYAQRRF